MKRRDFIKALPLGVAAASIPFSIPGFRGEAFGKSPLLNAILNGSDGSDRILVLINLQGGNDGLNCVIPFQDAEYLKQRKVIGFTASDLTDATKLRGDLALNPLMGANGASTNFAKLWSTGKLAVVQNVGYADANRSHFRSTDIWNSASDSQTILSTGWVGRYLETTRPGYPFDVATDGSEDPLALAVGYSTSLAFQGNSSIMGVAVSDPSKYSAAVDYPDALPPDNNYGHELGFVRNILKQSDVYGKRFKDLFPTVPTNNVAYPPANPLAQQLKKVAWCIAKGMKTKVYFVQQGGYDTHIQQNSKVNVIGQDRLLFELAEAISLFQADVEAMGNDSNGNPIADKVLGMTYSEFGRRVNENGSLGTDHGTAAPQFLFGTQVNGKEVYGNHPNLTDLDMYADLKQQFDFRQLYAGVLTDWFGMNDGVRKAILNNKDFGFLFPVNGSSKMQSLIKTPATIGVRDSYVQDKLFILQQNYPNPVVNETTIAFNLSESARVTLEVFDSRGELVATPVQSTLGRGEHPINFNANRLAAGTYFYRLDVNGNVETKAMKVVR